MNKNIEQNFKKNNSSLQNHTDDAVNCEDIRNDLQNSEDNPSSVNHSNFVELDMLNSNTVNNNYDFDCKNSEENYLVVSNVSKTYIGGYIGLASVSFTLKKKEQLTIIANAFGGKTTLLSLIAGLETATEGDIYLDGKLINNMPIKLRDIGYLDKSLQLNKFASVKNTICYPLKIRKFDNNIIEEKYAEIAKKLNIERLSDMKIFKLNEYQKRLVAIARLVVLDRKLYLIDDIFSALTLGEQHEFICILNDLFTSKTAIFALSNKATAEKLLSQNVLVLGYSTNIGYGNIHDKETFCKTVAGAKLYYNDKVCQLPCIITSKNLIVNDKAFPLKKSLVSDKFDRGTLIVDLSNVAFNDSKECCICSKIEYINQDNVAYFDIDGNVATINIVDRKYNIGEDIKFSFDLENCSIYDFDSERLIST